MKKSLLVLTMGFALFSMFFGAGNLVYPLKLGFFAKEGCLTAFAGFSMTAVIVPLIGFLSMMLYQGNFRAFFSQIGFIPGLVISTIALLVLGPVGALPRCIALTYSSVHEVFPSVTIGIFAFFACLVIFFLSIKESNILELLGKVLTPLLLITLGFVIISGIVKEHSFATTTQTQMEHFSQGLFEGYQTLDLVAAIVFSAFMYPALVSAASKNKSTLLSFTLKVSLIAGCLLGTTYFGFCYLAGAYGHLLQDSTQELMLIALSDHFLGSLGAKATMVLVILACLTTAIALAAIFAEFLKNDLFQGKVRYEWCLAITLFISYFFATLQFSGIVKMLAPILEVAYPALIVLALANMADKLFGFRYVKASFFLVLASTLICSFI
jgi:branched-chain amino acid:cation transporter, LIVCS family